MGHLYLVRISLGTRDSWAYNAAVAFSPEQTLYEVVACQEKPDDFHLKYIITTMIST
jgi:hypothetical protein